MSIDLVYGGIYGLLLIVAYIMGYSHGRKTGEKDGVDSCAKTAGELINGCCCNDCIDRIKKYADQCHV